MGVQKRFSDAASEKPNDYIPDEMKHDFLLLSSCDSKMNYPEMSSRTGKSYPKILLSVQHKWRFSEAVISATFGALAMRLFDFVHVAVRITVRSVFLR